MEKQTEKQLVYSPFRFRDDFLAPVFGDNVLRLWLHPRAPESSWKVVDVLCVRVDDLVHRAVGRAARGRDVHARGYSLQDIRLYDIHKCAALLLLA